MTVRCLYCKRYVSAAGDHFHVTGGVSWMQTSGVPREPVHVCCKCVGCLTEPTTTKEEK